MHERLDKLERQMRYVRIYSGLVTCILAVAILLAAAPKQEDILRARGLVIVDEAGRERILLGAPIPAAKNRIYQESAQLGPSVSRGSTWITIEATGTIRMGS
jgi:hypothetical protein